MIRLTVGLVGSLAGAVIRRRTRCQGHVEHPMIRPRTCRFCFEVME